MPLHIAIEAEQLSKIIKPEIWRVPSPGRDAFPMPSQRIEPEYRRFPGAPDRGVADRNMTPALHPGTVPSHEINRVVPPAEDGVRVVVAAGIQFGPDPAPMHQGRSG